MSNTKATCHPDRKVKARGLCAGCYQKWFESNHPEYKEKKKKDHDRWAKEHPDRIAKHKADRKQKEKNDPNYWLKKRNALLESTYGMSHDDYLRMEKEQGGLCAICRKLPTAGTFFHIDHDHKTGIVRGLLCHRCNWYLGLIDKDQEIIQRIKSYISKTQGEFICRKMTKNRQKV